MEFDVLFQMLRENEVLRLSLFVIALFLFSLFGPLISSFRRYRFCPRCGNRTRLGLRTEKIDARKKWVRVGRRWHYGGFVTKGTVIHHCPDCGWENDLGK